MNAKDLNENRYHRLLLAQATIRDIEDRIRHAEASLVRYREQVTELEAMVFELESLISNSLLDSK